MKHLRQLVLLIIGVSLVLTACAIGAAARTKQRDTPQSKSAPWRIDTQDPISRVKSTPPVFNFFVQKVSAVVNVRPSGNYADIGFITSEPAYGLIEVSTKRFNDFPDITPAGQQPAPAFPRGAVTMSKNDSLDAKRTQHTFRMEGLGPNRTYYLVITTTGADGRTFRYTDSFQTPDSRRVKVVFEKVNFTKKELAAVAEYPQGKLVIVRRQGLQLHGGVNGQWGSPQTGYWRYPRDGSFADIGGILSGGTYHPAGWEAVNIEAMVDRAPDQLQLKLLACDYESRKDRNTGYYGNPTFPADPRPGPNYQPNSDAGYNDLSPQANWSTASGQIDTTMGGSYQAGTGTFELVQTQEAIDGSHGDLIFEVTGRFEVSYAKPPPNLKDIQQAPDAFKQRKRVNPVKP